MNNILITGGTGSLGRALTRHILDKLYVRKLVIISRDEDKHKRMGREFDDKRLRFLIGDVRDRYRLRRAMTGIDYVFHCAALKDVPTGEYNPDEFKKTNIDGVQNVIDAAGEMKIQKVIGISTDKAVEALNAYGKSKAFADSLFINGNALYPETIYSLVRYGNVAGSRGSVIPLFTEMLEEGNKDTLPLTDPRMTRFWITMEEAVGLCMVCLEYMKGGEVFVAQMPSFRIIDLINVLTGKDEWTDVGIRPGEKLHEVVITEYDDCYEWRGYYIIYPQHFWKIYDKMGKKIKDGFRYSSHNNCKWLSLEEIKEKLKWV